MSDTLESMILMPIIDGDDCLVRVEITFYGSPGFMIRLNAKAFDELIEAAIALRKRAPR